MPPAFLPTKPRIVPSDWTVVPATHPPLRGGEPVAIQMSDGAILRGEWLCRSDKPIAVVALSHAMMVDRRTLDTPSGRGLLSSLLSRDLKVLWFDQRGHGQSVPLVNEGASWDYDTLVHDTGCISAYLASVEPNLPQIAMGHSLFGHLALAWLSLAALQAELSAFDGVVALASSIWLDELEPSKLRRLLKRASFQALLWASLPSGYFPSRKLGVGTVDEPRPYLRQMGSWVSHNQWTDRRGSSYLPGLAKVSVPILSVAGQGDRLLSTPHVQLRLWARTNGPLEHWQLGRRFGDAIDPNHMQVVTSSKLRPRWDSIADWVATPGRFDSVGGQRR